jgi:hypothetical protein
VGAIQSRVRSLRAPLYQTPDKQRITVAIVRGERLPACAGQFAAQGDLEDIFRGEAVCRRARNPFYGELTRRHSDNPKAGGDQDYTERQNLKALKPTLMFEFGGFMRQPDLLIYGLVVK